MYESFIERLITNAVLMQNSKIASEAQIYSNLEKKYDTKLTYN
jgi:hypothetical protein